MRNHSNTVCETPVTGYDWTGVRGGMRAAFSLPGLVMACSFIGFGALINDIGFPLVAGALTVPLIWALPGQVLFVTMWQAGLALVIIAAAVSLTAVRLLPMVIGVLAQVRIPGAPRWPEYVLAYFTAVTIWVLSVTHLDDVPKPQHLPWLVGLGSTLMALMMVVVPIGYHVSDLLPPVLTAAMVFFTPAFFLLSLMASARWRFDWAAIVIGAALLPLTRWLAPDFDLLIAGVGGGTLAFFLFRPRRRGLMHRADPHE
jgi:predicted branched-subunit amino acid permease